MTTWSTILFYVFIFIFNSLHVSSTSCSSSGETNCVNTTSGSCRWPCRVQGGRPEHDTATDTEWQLPEVVLTKFVSPDDERDVLEICRVKNKNKCIEKNCASRWSFTKNTDLSLLRFTLIYHLMSLGAQYSISMSQLIIYSEGLVVPTLRIGPITFPKINLHLSLNTMTL